MLLVKTKVAPSPVHGLGLFADQFIPRGTRIWEYSEVVDSRFDASRLVGLTEKEQDELLKHSYLNPSSGLYVVCGDDARYMNHADDPNTAFTDPAIGWTIRDIAEGEEITCNYAEFEPDFAMLPGRFFVAPSAGAGLSPE